MEGTLKKIVHAYRRFKYRKYGWSGNYASWQEAKAQCTGYDAANIIEKVRAGALKVKSGEALYERDAVTFNAPSYSWPLLANLFWIARQKGDKLSVLDFGGSLGSAYFQHRAYLNSIPALKWDVVEQHEYVNVGKKDIAEGPLNFHHTINEAIAATGTHDVLLISSVLPYIEKPYELLTEMMSKNFQYLMISLTYFNNRPGDRLTIQKVPAYYYEASYPAWFLDYDKLVDFLKSQYEMIAEFQDEEFLYLEGAKVNYKGFIMKRKSS